jgi:hypothetical protein
MSRDPSLAEVVNEAGVTATDDLYISAPGKVTAYDATTQKATVQPLVKLRHADENGVPVVQAVPPIPGVPVMFPGGGGFTVTFPINVGDTVLLVFSSTSLDKWLVSSTSGPVDPETYTRHALTDAIAIPGLRSFANARSGMPTNHVRIGSEAGVAQGVALGATLQTHLNTLEAMINDLIGAYNLHVHGAPGGATSAPSTTYPSLAPSTPDVASDTVKVTP